MRKSRSTSQHLDQRGVTSITIALTSTVMIIFAAFAIDIGHALVTKNELQNAADSAALAAGRQLGLMYVGWPTQKQLDTTYALTSTEQQPIINSAQTASQANKASNLSSVALMASDIKFGTWDFSSTNPTFVETMVQPNAIQVTARRDSTSGSPNGPISTFFAGIMGINQMDVNATAVAALATAGGTAPPGAGDAPFGLDEKIFTSKSCGDEVQFSPTQDSCAGWHSFTDTPANKPTIESQVNGLTADPPTFQSPETVAGVTQYTFSGGEIANLFGDLKNLMNAKAEWDPVDSRMEWNIHIPVYSDGSDPNDPCGNPSGSLTIVGYATASVYYIGDGGNDKTIKGQILCDTYFNATPTSNPGPGVPSPWLPKTPFPRLVS